MKRHIWIACVGMLAAGCASGADVANDETVPDSAVVETLEGIQPQTEARPRETLP
ncbi:MAG TPA: hypothetical protein VHG93_28205 [Longimicrobium sp.]|nr:hypothetical protein [Longimicrobium sp.]